MFLYKSSLFVGKIDNKLMWIGRGINLTFKFVGKNKMKYVFVDVF